MHRHQLRMSKIFLNSKKIEDIHKIINNTGKPKSHINMTTKKPSHKQIFIPMSNENITKFMASLEEHIANINHALKDIKLDIFIDFICFNHHGLIVTSNKVASSFNLRVVENYIRYTNSIDSNSIQTAYLSNSNLT